MGKGGGSSHTPKEQPDSLKSKQRLSVIDLICEGQIEGPVNGLQSVYLNDTPVQNEDGSYNFSGVDTQWHPGTQSQSWLEGFESSENEVPVSTEVKAATPLVRSITDPDVDRVRVTLGVSALFEQNNNGDVNGSNVTMLVQIGTGSNWETRERVLIEGKTRSQYLRSVFLTDLPPVPFNIRVVRETTDSTSSMLENKTLWSSYTEIIDTKLTYPNTALIGVTFDSEQFQGVPKRTYLIRGLMIKVPSNYDPDSRSYEGMWDGSFKIAWSNNPAWIFYDLVMNERYGLGKRVGSFGCDKWALYAIGQYCDGLVDDGYGNKEPRMVCNCYITGQRQAYDVLHDLASVFRAMPVWDGLQMTCIQDRPVDPVWRYTNANVVEGKFTYQSSAQKARHTAVHVRYIDPYNGWETATEYVADDAMIARYGLNVSQIDAFGCTSRGQAHRTGKWLLETERLEKQTVSFSVGREGIKHLPGDIIEVADNDYAGTRIGGRIKAINDQIITLDRDVQLGSVDRYHLGYIDSEGKLAKVEIIAQPSANQVTIGKALPELQAMSIWTLSSTQLSTRLFRAMSIKENDDGTYDISALQHEPQKETVVDAGAQFDRPTVTRYGHDIPPVEHLQVELTPEGPAQMRATWDTPRVVKNITFDIKLLRDGVVVLRDNTADTQYYLNDLVSGRYQLAVRAKDDNGRLGIESLLDIELSPPLMPYAVDINSSIWQITLTPRINGPVLFGTLFEFYFSEVPLELNQVESRAKRLVTSSYLVHDKLKPATTYYYWIRSVNGYGKSDFYATVASTSEDASEILDAIAGQIGKTQLAEELSKQIDMAATREELEQKLGELGLAGETLQEDLDETKKRLDAAAKAIVENAVGLDREVQQSRERDAEIIEAQQIIVNDQQALAQDVKQLNSAFDGQQSQITEIKTTVATQNEASSQQLLQLNAATEETDARLTELQTVVSTATDALSEKTQSLEASVNELVEADLIHQQQVLANEQQAQASELHALSAGFEQQQAQISITQQAVAGHQQSTTQALTQLNSKTDNTNAKVTDLESAVASATEAQANRTDSLEASIVSLKERDDANAAAAIENSLNQDVEKGRQRTINASIFNQQQVLVDGQKAIAEVTQILKSDVGENSALLSQQGRTIAGLSDEIDSVAQFTQTLQSSVGANSASIEQQAKTVAKLNGDLASMWSVKLGLTSGGKYYAAGIGLGIENTSTGLQSQFLVSADRFAVIDPSTSTLTTPFAIQNGQTYINQALIKDGTITNAKIVDGAITNAKISDGVITNAKIANAAINSAKIQDLTVTTLKIQDNAVTVPKTYSWSGKTYGSNARITMLNGSAVYDFDTQVIIICALRNAYPHHPNTSYSEARILVDGTVVADFAAGAPNDSPVLMTQMKLSKGTHIFQVDWLGMNSNVELWRATLAIWGAMK